MSSNPASRTIRLLPTLLALVWASGTAYGVELVFDFNTRPCPPVKKSDTCAAPTFTNGNLVLSHSQQAIWRSNRMELLGDKKGHPAKARMSFSEPVTSVEFDMIREYLDYKIVITPILAGSNAPDNARAITLLPAKKGNTKFTVEFTESGPYIGVEIASPAYPSDTSKAVRWDNVKLVTGYPSDALNVREVFIAPNGDNPVPILELNHFKSTSARVADGGRVDADFCIAPDPREKMLHGKWAYAPRVLLLRELKGTGTCTGPIPGGTAYATWEHLLEATRLTIAPWFRAFKGKPWTGGAGIEGVEGYWIVVSAIQSTAAHDGPVVSIPIPEALIDFGPLLSPVMKPDEEFPEINCSAHPDWRPLTLGGTVAAFGDDMNVEGELMIVETAQCDRGVALSRKTTHAYPMRLDGFFLDELVNITQQFAGLTLTLERAGKCMNSQARTQLSTLLATAKLAALLRQWDQAINRMEQFAIKADTANFTGCPTSANYKGGLISRSITIAFTLHDRFKHQKTAGWKVYFPPEELELPGIYRQTSD